MGIGVLQPTEGAVKLVSLEAFEVGVKATDMKACAIEFSRLQTGRRDFLKSFQVKIDFKKKFLRLDKP